MQLVRLLRLSQLARRLKKFIAVKMLRIVYLALLYTTIAHWIACGFFFVVCSQTITIFALFIHNPMAH